MISQIINNILTKEKSMKKLIQAYKATELAIIEKRTKPTIYNNWKKYIPIKIASRRAKKWYSIRYIKKVDLDNYFNQNTKKDYTT